MDEGAGTTTKDSSGQGNTGTLTGANGLPVWTAGCKRSGCLTFDGVDDYITTSFSLNPSTSNFTASVWVYLNAAAASKSIIQQLNGVGTGRTWLGINSGSLQFGSFLGGTDTLTGTVPNAGQWYHLAITNSSGTLTIYLNGVSVVSAARTIESSTGVLEFATSKGHTNFLSGLLDDVRIYNRALTTQEINDLYVSGIKLNNCKLKNAKLNF